MRRLLELDPAQAGLLLRSRSAEVRALAVAALPDGTPDVLARPPADRSPLVRAPGPPVAGPAGLGPPADVYRARLRREGVPVTGLVEGLGECGDASDVPLLAGLAGPGLPAPVRRAAVRALGRLAKPVELPDLLAPLIPDPAPGIADAALAVLRRRGA